MQFKSKLIPQKSTVFVSSQTHTSVEYCRPCCDSCGAKVWMSVLCIWPTTRWTNTLRVQNLLFAVSRCVMHVSGMKCEYSRSGVNCKARSKKVMTHFCNGIASFVQCIELPYYVVQVVHAVTVNSISEGFLWVYLSWSLQMLALMLFASEVTSKTWTRSRFLNVAHPRCRQKFYWTIYLKLLALTKFVYIFCLSTFFLAWYMMCFLHDVLVPVISFLFLMKNSWLATG